MRITVLGTGYLGATHAASLAEMGYEFVANTVKDSAGHDGMKFMPLVFSLFMFVLVCNMLGMIPGAFTVTSHLTVTAITAAVDETALAADSMSHTIAAIRSDTENVASEIDRLGASFGTIGERLATLRRAADEFSASVA